MPTGGNQRRQTAINYSDHTMNNAPERYSAGKKLAKGEESWRNSEGETLGDFGVDEVAEFYDEDNLSLAELLRRRRPVRVV